MQTIKNASVTGLRSTVILGLDWDCAPDPAGRAPGALHHVPAEFQGVWIKHIEEDSV